MLIIMCGPPGSGKSTYLQNIRECIDCGSTGVIVLCPDEFRKTLTGADYHEPAEDMVWSHVKTVARVLLDIGHSVIIDGTHLTKESRKIWITIAEELNVDISCVWMDTPFAVCVERNKARQRKVPDEIINRMFAEFRPPCFDEGFLDIERMKSIDY
ncbi:hypothetical protein LCGC14_0143100 [marine sediment metagenome]|uniref:Zeta toxin domain-containing protein n=1 Tax=marine sediment metagenome TaxID=412755 RepID=A0A0F9Y2X0_9ZZZZ